MLCKCYRSYNLILSNERSKAKVVLDTTLDVLKKKSLFIYCFNSIRSSKLEKNIKETSKCNGFLEYVCPTSYPDFVETTYSFKEPQLIYWLPNEADLMSRNLHIDGTKSRAHVSKKKNNNFNQKKIDKVWFISTPKIQIYITRRK
jgi:hypothetical protein